MVWIQSDVCGELSQKLSTRGITKYRFIQLVGKSRGMDGLASKPDKEASRQTDRFASILLIALSCLRNQARTQTQQRSLKIEEIAVMVEFSTTVGEDKCYVR